MGRARQEQGQCITCSALHAVMKRVWKECKKVPSGWTKDSNAVSPPGTQIYPNYFQPNQSFKKNFFFVTIRSRWAVVTQAFNSST